MSLKILESVTATALFIVLIEMCACWLFFDKFYNDVWILKHYEFICGFIEVPVLMLSLAFLQDSKFIDIQATQNRFYPLAAVLGLLFIYAQLPLNMAYNYIANDSYTTVLNNGIELGQAVSFNAFSTIVLIPIVEEFYFRKFIQGALLKELLPGVSIVLSALFFSVIHLGITGTILFDFPLHYHHTYITIFGGLIAAYLYHKSGSVGPAILFHVFWNLGATVL